MSNLFGGGSKVKMPVVTAEAPKVTAAALPQPTENEKLAKRLAASQMKDWGELTLGQPGLLG